MDLSQYKFPEVSKIDPVFSTFDIPVDLLEEAQSRRIQKGVDKFNELFFEGGEVTLQSDVTKEYWKFKAYCYALCLMRSRKPKHEDKEAVVAMLFEEILVL